MKTICLSLSLTLFLTGCWTFNETSYPAVQTTPAATNAKTVRLTGFETLLTEWQPVHTYRTVLTPGYCGYRHYEPGCLTTVPAVDYIPQKRSSDMFLLKAQDLFEQAGFVLAPTAPDFTVDVHFAGPFEDSSDELKNLAWNVCTVFFCDRGAARWTAQLRIRETKTGKLVFHHDYEQTYATNVFGLVPIFGALSCDATDAGRMQTWCLSALTDRVCADATAFVAGK